MRTQYIKILNDGYTTRSYDYPSFADDDLVRQGKAVTLKVIDELVYKLIPIDAEKLVWQIVTKL